MKRLLAILIAAGLILAACAVDGSRGGGSFDGSDDPSAPLGASSTPLPADAPPPPAVALTCTPEMLNLGDPALWVEGATVVIAIGITDATLLPARLTSDNGLDFTFRTLEEVSRGGSYGPLGIPPSPARTLTLTLANGAVCTATATILSATPTPIPTDTPVPSPTPLPTETPTPIPTLAPIVSTAAPTPTITATVASLPVTGWGEEENQPPKSPLETIWELILIFFGGG